MKFRPRYSLLAFLLFTAAVAVGVKLWRGPHHVVDRSNPQMEDEYTYYRDWDGTKIVDGVRVRKYHDKEQIFFLSIDLYRQGALQENGHYTVAASEEHSAPGPIFRGTNQAALTNGEREQLAAAVQRAEELIRSGGGSPTVSYGYW